MEVGGKTEQRTEEAICGKEEVGGRRAWSSAGLSVTPSSAATWMVGHGSGFIVVSRELSADSEG